MPYEFTLTTKLPATPQQIYDAWMSSEGHTAMTGAIARIGSDVGSRFEAWDGYITGETIELDPGKHIRQTWRTRHFDAEHADSVIDIKLVPNGDMTLLTLHHSNVPDGQTSYEDPGWQRHYFEPMHKRFTWLRMQANM